LGYFAIIIYEYILINARLVAGRSFDVNIFCYEGSIAQPR
jgi:hypothetical protein